MVTNNELDDSNLSETKKKKVENYRKRNKKTVLIVGDSMLNGNEESKLSKTRHIGVQLFSRVEKLMISKKILMIYYLKNYKR